MRAYPILVFDTSCHALSMTLTDGKWVYEERISGLMNHSEKLFECVELMVRKSIGKMSKLKMIAVGTGPGSFTGIRVAVTVAKTLAYATGAKLAGISTLHMIAANCEPSDVPICVVQDARRSRVYTATYYHGLCIRKPTLMHTGDFIFELKPKMLYVGDGLEKFAHMIENKFSKKAYMRDRRKWYPNPLHMLPLAMQYYEKKKFIDPVKLVPEYLYEDTCNVTPKKS